MHFAGKSKVRCTSNAMTITLLNTLVREAIYLSSDPNTWLTIIRPSADGTCASVNSTGRTSVTFGVDMRTGCTIR